MTSGAVKERGRSILNSTIDEFIRTGEPVSSERLFRKFRFGIKPAMIRYELHQLTDDGYLAQTHISSGRIPTDKGYRFFVNHLTEEMGQEIPTSFLKSVLRIKKSFLRDLSKGIKELGDLVGGAGAVVGSEEGRVYKSGLDRLLDSMDEEMGMADIRQVVKDFEELDAVFEKAEEFFEEDNNPFVFIGRESPWTESDQLSVIGAKVEGEAPVELVFLCPKRTNYQKNLGILKAIININGGE